MAVFTIQNLKDAGHTAQKMYEMVDKYHMDMAKYATYPLSQIFDKIKKIPFRPDPTGIEVLQRPYFTMEKIGIGGDCDDKAIAFASWAKLNGIPFLFVATGKAKDRVKNYIPLTHVFTKIYYMGKWVYVDPTYSFNLLGRIKRNYARIETLWPLTQRKN